MKRLFAALFYIGLAAGCHAQKNQVVISANGNWNPTTHVTLTAAQPPVVMRGSNRSSVGGGIEYDYLFSPKLGLGAMEEQNPSDGKLLSGDRLYVWPVMRYEFAALMTESFPENGSRWTPYLQEGAGYVVTESLVQNSGWSHDPAFIWADGVDFALSNRAALRIGNRILLSEGGCYNGKNCAEEWGLTDDPEIGVRFAW